MRSLLFAVVLLVTGGSPAWADASTLVWTQREVKLTAEPGQERIEAVFPFRNEGKKPVTIIGVESSCGCTTAQLAKTTYAPGESGEIHAKFEFGGRTGIQQKALTVATDEATDATQLFLEVTIPVIFSIEQRVVIWTLGAEPAVRTVAVRTAPGVKVDNLTYDEAAVEASFAPQPDGSGYVLSLRLKSTAAVQRQTVMVHALVAGKAQALPVHLFVR